MLLFTSPFTPMLFMGEEWAAATPWQFFTSHPEPDLADAVGAGAAGPSSPGTAGPRPTSPIRRIPETFARSKLDWAERDEPDHAADAGGLPGPDRAAPPHRDLSDPRLDLVDVAIGDDVARIRRGTHTVLVNVGAGPATVDAVGALVYATDPAIQLGDGALRLPPESGAILGC